MLRARQLIESYLKQALAEARRKGLLTTAPSAVLVEPPKEAVHGDFSTNVAMVMAREERKSPRAIAEIVVGEMGHPAELSEITIAGPGFINFRMTPEFWREEIRRGAEGGRTYLVPQLGNGERIQVEFLSANPTGPLTVGHGRNAVLGDTLARLYEATGHAVTREYYFNNGGRQMKLLGASVRARYLEELGLPAEFPAEGYQGEYIRELARKMVQKHGNGLAESSDLAPFIAEAAAEIFADIRRTCERLRVGFDSYTNELDLIREGKVEQLLSRLKAQGLTTERDGALWLRGDPIGLPKDEVLVRSGAEQGEPTYRTTDMAYHIEKLARGFDLIIGVFGADHIAEHRSMISTLEALGYDVSPFRSVIYQFVTLTRGGQKVKMSTRRAEYVTLDELIDEVGVDVTRFFFLFRKSDTHLEFDLELAKRQAPENPVYYVQYAHARLASIFREAERQDLQVPVSPGTVPLEKLSEEEIRLGQMALNLPVIITECVKELEPHRLAFYLVELAGAFHRYYNKPTNRVVNTSDRPLSQARLLLAGLVREALAHGLGLLGVTAPDKM